MNKVHINKVLHSMPASIISISEVKRSKQPYLKLHLYVADDSINKNGERVTREFLEDIAGRSEEFSGVPLQVDIDKVKRGDYDKGLTHLQDGNKGVFHSTQIGSLQKFWLSEENGRLVLMAEARVFKRSAEMCNAVLDLYEQGKLFVSFEIEIGESSIENGVRVVDVSESNNLIGLCLVSNPAYQNATAVYLAASVKDKDEAFTRATMHSTIRLAEAGVIVGEASLETIARMVYMAVEEYTQDEFYEMSFLHIGVGSALLYHNRTGQFFSVDYIIREDGIYISDFYESKIARYDREPKIVEQDYKESEVSELDKELEKVNTEEIVTEEVVAEEAVVKEAVAEETIAEKVAEETTDKEVVEETIAEEVVSEKDITEEVVLSELEKTVAEQAARIAELEEAEKELSAIKLAEEQAVIAEKREKLSVFVTDNGLDTGDEMVASALQEMNYEKLVNMVMSNSSSDKGDDKSPTVQIAENTVNHMVDNMETKGSWLFQK